MELFDNNDFEFPFERVRVIPLKYYPGDLNMAIDYYFSQQMNRIKEPVFRFYGWDPYCLSFGRHQDISEVNFKKLQSDGFNSVRRPTGGSAIFHSEELTYSIVIPNEIVHHKELYILIHQILYQTLTKLDFPVELHLQNDKINYLKNGNATFICFNRSAYTEIKFKKKKLIGSAQKIYPYAILQHGSILIGSTQNKVSEYFGKDRNLQAKNLKYLSENSISLDNIKKSGLSAEQLSKYITDELGNATEIYKKPLTNYEIASAKNYCSEFKIKNIN